MSGTLWNDASGQMSYLITSALVPCAGALCKFWFVYGEEPVYIILAWIFLYMPMYLQYFSSQKFCACIS